MGLFQGRQTRRGLVIMAVASLLSACGGGGDGDKKPVKTIDPPANVVQSAVVSPLNLASLGALPNGSTSTRTEVPVTVHRTSAGDTFMTVPITVGNTTLQALLDTGSPGLRVLPGALQSTDYVATATTSRISFQGGEDLAGVSATAVVQVGGASTASPIAFTLTQTVGCRPEVPDCPASDGDGTNYRFLQETPGSGLGYKAVLGVSLRGDTAAADGVFSPLAQIGRATFIIQMDQANGTGKLIINPDARDDSGWVPFGMYSSNTPLPNGLTDWADYMLSGCILDHSTRTQSCGYVMLDSGSPRTLVFDSQVRASSLLPAGSSLQMLLYQDQTHAVQSPRFSSTVQHPVSGNASIVMLEPLARVGDPTQLIWGSMIFQQYDVVFSHVGGFIGLREPTRRP